MIDLKRYCVQVIRSGPGGQVQHVDYIRNELLHKADIKSADRYYQYYAPYCQRAAGNVG